MWYHTCCLALRLICASSFHPTSTSLVPPTTLTLSAMTGGGGGGELSTYSGPWHIQVVVVMLCVLVVASFWSASVWEGHWCCPQLNEILPLLFIAFRTHQLGAVQWTLLVLRNSVLHTDTNSSHTCTCTGCLFASVCNKESHNFSTQPKFNTLVEYRSTNSYTSARPHGLSSPSILNETRKNDLKKG